MAFAVAISAKKASLSKFTQIWAKEVAFEPVHDEAMNDRIDEAYRAKYAKSPYLKPMISDRARAATVRIAPRETNS